ncbi:hypothetical protein CBR_g32299 [Chara braunii]|uniref:Cilia- and flagella-associated protein 206 n=1 Tax=Chara braunii TaxID=69332 RepID=A0A388JN97_CHABU|nr:hypothetical protein CBR_g32299 [Chara braunii]|eukprot:GBG59286.1 hypothetical protein CBR_g32299 [Chara braunii]
MNERSFVRQAVREIQLMCREHSNAVNVPQRDICFMVRVFMLDYLSGAPMPAGEYQRMKDELCQKFIEPDLPSMQTIRLQLVVDESFLLERQSVEEQLDVNEKEAEVHLKKAVNIEVINERQEAEVLDALQAAILVYTRLKHGVQTQSSLNSSSSLLKAAGPRRRPLRDPLHRIKLPARFSIVSFFSQLETDSCPQNATERRGPFQVPKVHGAAMLHKKTWNAAQSTKEEGPDHEKMEMDRVNEAEMEAALESIFPRHSYRKWMLMEPEPKSTQLEEIGNIVMGIWLFNKHAGRGGKHLEDASVAYQERSERARQQIAVELEQAEQDVTNRMMVTEFWQRFRNKQRNIQNLRDEMHHRFQYIKFLEVLKKEEEDGATSMADLTEKYRKALKTLVSIIGDRASVPKHLVYPLFSTVGSIHVIMQEELLYLKARLRALEIVLLYGRLRNSELKIMDLRRARRWLKTRDTFSVKPAASEDTKGQMPELSTKLSSPSGKSGVQYISATQMGAYLLDGEPPTPELEGFCVVTMVDRKGLAVPGKTDLGTLRYRSKFYTFADLECMKRFSDSPEQYLEKVKVVAKEIPQLIRLLGFHRDLWQATNISQVLGDIEQPLGCDIGTQTPVHFRDRFIDYSYEWSEWGLRRRAIHLANLRNKGTHSSQTVISHLHRDNEVQVWLPKAAETQSKKHGATKMPKKLRYIRGLRGPPDVQMNVVNVQLEV